ncbi:MAG: quinol dehydrogenase ferredoxin subunit NapH [bacterium]|nr:quinol dehydrogenase ferredoxin subunit NapH [bacterium]MCP5070294.1 quinol dehydrogenase ferredoxin subunit NapH [bacterium]
MSWILAHRYLVLRRLSQAGILLLFWLGAQMHMGWLTGNLSSSRVLRTLPLSDPYAALQVLATGHPITSTVLLGAVLVAVFYWMVGGRSFCSWVCPVNPVADLGRVIKRRFRPQGQLPLERQARYGFMLLGLVLSGILGVAAFEWISPIGMLHREVIFGAGLGLLVIPWILLLDVFVLRHGWCGSLCPLGAFYALIGQISLLRPAFAAERCDRCGDCVRVCPEPQVLHFDRLDVMGFVGAGECTNCARCIEVCTRDAFSFDVRPGYSGVETATTES